MSTITREQILHIAKLSELALTEEEVVSLGRDLSNVIGYMDKLNELDTTKLHAVDHAMPVPCKMREDAVGPSWDREALLSNTKAAEDGFFTVPKVIG